VSPRRQLKSARILARFPTTRAAHRFRAQIDVFRCESIDVERLKLIFERKADSSRVLSTRKLVKFFNFLLFFAGFCWLLVSSPSRRQSAALQSEVSKGRGAC
jgi:hypothetical protein